MRARWGFRFRDGAGGGCTVLDVVTIGTLRGAMDGMDGMEWHGMAWHGINGYWVWNCEDNAYIQSVR